MVRDAARMGAGAARLPLSLVRRDLEKDIAPAVLFLASKDAQFLTAAA
jgi:DNA-binding transcriptional LysR family regulator